MQTARLKLKQKGMADSVFSSRYTHTHTRTDTHTHQPLLDFCFVATHVAFYYAVMLAPRCDSGALRLKLGYDCIGAGGATCLGLRLAHPKTPTLTMLVLPIAERSNRKIRDLGLMCWTGWA